MKKILLFILLCACTVKQNRGFYVKDKEKVENFDVYNFTKQDVIDNVGNPSVELNDKTWLYYSYTTENYNFLKPKIKNEDILIVYFNDDDTINSFSYKNKNDTKNLKNINNEETENRKKNIFKSIFDGLMFTPMM